MLIALDEERISQEGKCHGCFRNPLGPIDEDYGGLGCKVTQR